jgi:hypothetical protein
MGTAGFGGDAQVLGHHARGSSELHDLLARAWPWAALLVISMTLAWAMNVGVTAFQHTPDQAQAQQVSDEDQARPQALSPQGFILTPAFKDLDGAPASVMCRTSRDLVSTDDMLYMPAAQDTYEQVTALCAAIVSSGVPSS